MISGRLGIWSTLLSSFSPSSEVPPLFFFSFNFSLSSHTPSVCSQTEEKIGYDKGGQIALEGSHGGQPVPALMSFLLLQIWLSHGTDTRAAKAAILETRPPQFRGQTSRVRVSPNVTEVSQCCRSNE